MNKLLLCAVAVGALVALAPVRADDKPARGDKDNPVFRSVDLIGKAVRNAKGEALGKVEDFVIDMKDAHIVYVAVGYGETLGFGGKLFAVPPQGVKLTDDWTAFIMNANKDDFDKAQGFDQNKWPTTADPRWYTGTGKDDVRKDAPPANKGEDAHLRRLSSLTGTTVRNNDNETLGSAQGFGIDLHHNKVVYTVLAYGGVAGVGSKYFAVPWEAAEMKSPDLRSSGKVFVIKANKSDFENSPGFDYKTWPNKPDARFTKDGARKD
jgi:sporulation protein YlmC with PRC-barrel domain